jgi:hypothetical protein
MRFIFDAIIAIGSYIIADKVTEKLTGRGIPEHVFQWWCEMRDYLNRWLAVNKQLGIHTVGVVILDKIDNFAVRTKQLADRVTLRVVAHDKNGCVHEVTSGEVSWQEVLAQFPGLANSKEVLIPVLTA